MAGKYKKEEVFNKFKSPFIEGDSASEESD